MKENILPAIRLTLVLFILFPGIYTGLILGAAQLANGAGKGAVILSDGQKQYAGIGQKFTEDKYFWSRPSAVDYNASGAGGSNKGPANPAYLALVQTRIDTFMVHNPGIPTTAIPSDLVTASGSGLDPDISVQAARVQVQRIARIRGVAEGNLEQLILSCTQKPFLGLFGTERINVLELNTALDHLK